MTLANPMAVVPSCYVPTFYSDDSLSTKEFVARDDHLNQSMRDEIRQVRATDNDCTDSMTNGMDSQKCSDALWKILPTGREFASVTQLKAMVQMFGESWGFIVSRDGCMIRYV